MNDGADLEANKDGQSKKGEKAALETPDNRGKLSLHQERYIQKITSSTSKRNSSSNPLPLWHRPQLEFASIGGKLSLFIRTADQLENRIKNDKKIESNKKKK